MAFGENDEIVAASGGFGGGDAVLGGTPMGPRRALDFGDAVISGIQNSATGLLARGKMPSVEMDKDAPWYHRLGANAASVLTDLPLSILGAVPGAALGQAAIPVPGVGAAVGGGAGAFAVPMALRDALVEAYNGNHALSWQGVWEISKAALKGGTKGAVIGAATAGAGRAVAPLVQGTAAKAVTSTGAELATLTATSAALEGHMPTWQDFMDNAILLGGMKAAVGVAKNLRNTYAETGKLPSEVLADAQKDPALKAELTEPVPKTFSEAETQGFTIKAYRGVNQDKPFNDSGTAWFSSSKDVAEAYAREVWGYDKPAVLEVRIRPTVPQYDIRKLSPEDYVKLGGNDNLAPQALGRYLNADDSPLGTSVRHATYHVPMADVWFPGKKVEAVPPAYAPLALEQRIQASLDFDPRPEAIRSLMSDPSRPIKLGEPPVADPVRLEYVVDADTHKGLLRLITERYSTEIETQRRGVVSNTQTLAEAKDMLVGGRLGPHEVGAAANAAESAARLMVLRSAVHDTHKKLEALRNTPEPQQTPLMRLEAYAALEKLSVLKAESDGVMAEWGRAGQMVRELKRNPELLGDAEALLGLVERKGKLQDIAALAGRLRDGTQLSRLAQDYVKATTTEKVIEAWKASILSGPLTHMANNVGNLAKWAVELVEAPLAATIEAGQRSAKGDSMSPAQWRARAFAPVLGIANGAREAMLVASEVWKGQGERLEKADVYRHAIEGKKGEIIRIPFKLLQVQDAFFRTFAERGQSYIMAVDRATKEGIHPATKEWRIRVEELTAQPELGLSAEAAAKAIERVQQAGAEAVFAQRLGPGLEMAQAAMNKHAPAMQFVVPFIRTPANLVSWAVQHVPGLNLISGRWRQDFAAGGEARARAIARVVVGTGITTLAYSLAQQGLLTGGGLFDKELRGTKSSAGVQPYSLKIGDTYYSYQRVEPVAKVLGVAADLFEMLTKADKEEDKAKLLGMAVLMFGNATVSTTYLSGLSNAIQSITDPARYGENWLEQYATSVVPKIVGQTTALADPHKREVEGVIDAIQSQIPILREKLLPKRDVWGQPVANDRWFAVMPVTVTKASEEKVKTEALRLAVAIADAPRYLSERSPFNPKDERIKLQPEQRDIFREVSGTNAMTILAPIVAAQDWDRIPNFAKAEVFRKVIEGTRKQAQYAALPPDDAARSVLRQKLVDRVIKETQEAGGK